MKEKIRKYIFKGSAKPQLEVISLPGLLQANKAMLISPHRTDFYHIFFFKNCRPAHRVDFKAVQATPYSLLFIDKERVHHFDGNAAYDGAVLVFTDSFFCHSAGDAKVLYGSTLFSDIKGDCLLPLDENTFRDFWELSEAIRREMLEDDPATSPVIAKNLLHNLLLLAQREKQKQGQPLALQSPEYARTLLFRELLEKNFRAEKTVLFYARRLAVTERRLGQATTSALGKLPKEMISERVMLEAKRLLVHGGCSVKETAFDLGFEEPTNFIKYFRKHAGLTPVEFRNQFVQAA